MHPEFPPNILGMFSVEALRRLADQANKKARIEHKHWPFSPESEGTIKQSLDDNWDALLAHPLCTRWTPSGDEPTTSRYQKGMALIDIRRYLFCYYVLLLIQEK